MRTVFLTVLLLLPFQLLAADLISQPHAMFYYRVPLDGNEVKQRQHSFGFRMDRASFSAGEMVGQHELFNQNAMFDFKMSSYLVSSKE